MIYSKGNDEPLKNFKKDYHDLFDSLISSLLDPCGKSIRGRQENTWRDIYEPVAVVMRREFGKAGQSISSGNP